MGRDKQGAALFILFYFNLGIALAQAPVIVYSSPKTYPVNTQIAPLAPTNKGGAVSTALYGQVSTFAGTVGVGGGADGYGTSASFRAPTSLTVDKAGNVYVSDQSGGGIRKITPAGLVSTLVRDFGAPNGVAVDAAGNVYFADSNQDLILKITPGGVLSTYAGDGLPGSKDGPLSTAEFNDPTGIAMDAAGNIFVADGANNTIRKITTTGMVSTLAGNPGVPGSSDGQGSAAGFSAPYQIAVDGNGNIFVADFINNLIRKVTPGGYVTTVAGYTAGGSNDGVGTAAGFIHPLGVTVDPAGNVYASDIGNGLIRRITPDGGVTTIAGIAGQRGLVNGISTSAVFNLPDGLGINSNGILYIVDNDNYIIRKMTLSGYTIDKPLPPGLSFNQSTGVISGTPTAASPATDYTVTAYNADGMGSTIVNIQITNGALKPSIITFPPPILVLGPNNDYDPRATSTNNETPIIYTSSNPAVATIDVNRLVHIVGPGVSIITATQSGDANYSPAQPVTEILTVTESQEITFPVIDAKATCDADFPVNATSTNSTLPLTYTSSNPTVATISSTGIIHIVGAGSTTIMVSQAGNNLYTPAIPQSQVLIITQAVIPSVSISVNYAGVCTGSPVTFTAAATNGGTNPIYQWQVNGKNVGTNSSTYTTTAIAYTDGVQCIITNTESCNLTGTSNIISHVSTVPYTGVSILVTSSAFDPICSGDEVTFRAFPSNPGNAPKYQWKINGVNTGTDNSVFSTTALKNNDIVTCILINTDNDPCLVDPTGTSNLIQTIVLPSVPANPSVTIAADNSTVCAGSPVTFTATPGNAGVNPNYQWQINGVSAGTNAASFTVSTLQSDDQVTCIVSNSAACSVGNAVSNPVSIAITPTNPPIVVSVSPATVNTCAGTPIAFKAITANAGSDAVYQWQVNGVNNGTNSPSFTSSALQTGDKVTCTVNSNIICSINSATSGTASINITAYTTASVSIQPSVGGIVCSGTNISFTAAATNQGSNPIYQWQVNAVNAGSNSPTFASSTFADGDVVTCSLTNTSSACLTASTVNSNSIKLNITPVSSLVPTVSVTPDVFDGCTGMSLTYTATATNAGNNPVYQWMVNGQGAGTNASTFTSSTLVTGDLISCKVTSSIACSVATATSNTATLTADPYADNSVSITSTAVNNIISPGELVLFTAKSGLTATGTTSLVYQWQVNNIDAGSNSPFFSTTDLKNNDVITCVLSTSGKCIGTPVVISNPIEILVITPVVVVNTFTPNGDGVNDTWDIPSLAAYPNCAVSIFNRYGALVYKTIGYPKPWDGTYEGKPLPTGVYYYVIDLKNGKNKLSGSLTILK